MLHGDGTDAHSENRLEGVDADELESCTTKAHARASSRKLRLGSGKKPRGRIARTRVATSE